MIASVTWRLPRPFAAGCLRRSLVLAGSVRWDGGSPVDAGAAARLLGVRRSGIPGSGLAAGFRRVVVDGTSTILRHTRLRA